ncbi:MAG TPA: Ricin and poly(3-hydroxybutyrate) depolymerase fusion [Polyangiaceae bacterium]|nr:Ricin and poly(3-hydroxybutyrate) depolymerase fusion [Polyangiaceae bacterium]
MNAIRVAYLLTLISSIGCGSNEQTPSPVSGEGTTTRSSTATLDSPQGNGGGTSSSQTSVSSTGGASATGTGALSAGGTSGDGSTKRGATTNANGGTASSRGSTTRGSSGGTNSGASNSGASNSGGNANGRTSTRGGATVGGSSSSQGAAAGPAPGCGKAAQATGAQELTIPIAGTDRSYILFIPTNYDSSKALPLVFAWHGLGGSGALARQYFGLERAASNQAILVYPSGLPTTDGKTGWTLTQDGVDIQFFDALLVDISEKYCVDRARVFSTGHSFGAMMTNALGCFRGDVLRGVAPVAGMPPFGRATCSSPVAAWISHGENDATVDFTDGGIASRDFWIKLNGCSLETEPAAVDPSPCVAYEGCSEGHPVHWCVHQSNHNWPSFAAAGIWAFFDGLKG